MNFKEELEQRTQSAWAVVEEYLPKEEGFSGNLAKAINYSMRAGGKRLRPVFMAAMYEMLGGNSEIVKPFMAAIEMTSTGEEKRQPMWCLGNLRLFWQEMLC